MARRKFNELRSELADKVGSDRLDANAKAAIERYDEETQRLADVRRARALTQSQLAQALGVSQAQVSRIERQSDLYLSTLASYIEAMGGELQLVAAFGEDRIQLSIGDRHDPVTASSSVGEKVPDLMAAMEASLASVRAEDDPLAALTPRERRILTLIGAGRSPRDIADDLNLSGDAVKQQLQQARLKLFAALSASSSLDE
jgi:DNA-binding CsgD family transcriptional regulator/DNA-binding XRE family transcriptional regulator